MPARISYRLPKPKLGAPLSKREREVLISTTRGGGYKMAACELRINVETVKNHLQSVYEKLGARNRNHAVMIALKSGIIGLEEL